MKKTLLFIASVLAIAACKDTKVEPEPTPEVKDEVSVSPESKTFDFQGGTVDVKVTSSADWTMTAGGTYDWVTASAESGANGASVKFTVAANNSGEEKVGEFTFKVGSASAKFAVISKPEDAEPAFLTLTSAADVTVPAETSELEISLSTNVNIAGIKASAEGADWLTFKESKAGTAENTVNVYFTVAKNTTDQARTATVTVSAEECDPVSVNVKQSAAESGGGDPEPADERPVINMTDARLFPVAHTWANAEPLRNMETFTLEAMVYPQTLDKSSNTYESLSSIMGIEGKFLVRFGDSGIENNQLQVATSKGNVTSDDLLFDLNRWYHIAVTFNAGEITIYVDGVNRCTGTVDVASVDFGMPHTNEDNGWNSDRCFWIGYSYNTERDFQGQMAEVRIWNKALTETDLKAENHFYSVDPDSEGLVAYWKLDDGEGTTVKDYTGNGNNLEGQHNLSEDSVGGNTYNGTNVKGDSVINWETSTLR